MPELPTNINDGVNVTSSNFYSEHVNLKELDYFYSNSKISLGRISKCY